MNDKSKHNIPPKDMDVQSRKKWAEKNAKKITESYPVFRDEPTGVISGNSESIEEEQNDESTEHGEKNER